MLSRPDGRRLVSRLLPPLSEPLPVVAPVEVRPLISICSKVVDTLHRREVVGARTDMEVSGGVGLAPPLSAVVQRIIPQDKASPGAAKARPAGQPSRQFLDVSQPRPARPSGTADASGALRLHPPERPLVAGLKRPLFGPDLYSRRPCTEFADNTVVGAATRPLRLRRDLLRTRVACLAAAEAGQTGLTDLAPRRRPDDLPPSRPVSLRKP